MTSPTLDEKTYMLLLFIAETVKPYKPAVK